MKIDNPPAFPVKVKRNTSTDPLATPREIQLEGMTLRDWFAGQFLTTLPEFHVAASADDELQAVAVQIYRMADAMLAARGDA